MLFDFNDFAPLRAWIDGRLDHGTMLNISDPLVDILTALPATTPMCKVFTMLDNPTSENLAREILHKATELLHLKDTNAFVGHVIVSETCTSRATYYG
jgi:6-pyruvoyl-tetrahydropterin synthase